MLYARCYLFFFFFFSILILKVGFQNLFIIFLDLEERKKLQFQIGGPTNESTPGNMENCDLCRDTDIKWIYLFPLTN